MLARVGPNSFGRITPNEWRHRRPRPSTSLPLPRFERRKGTPRPYFPKSQPDRNRTPRRKRSTSAASRSAGRRPTFMAPGPTKRTCLATPILMAVSVRSVDTALTLKSPLWSRPWQRARQRVEGSALASGWPLPGRGRPRARHERSPPLKNPKLACN